MSVRSRHLMVKQQLQNQASCTTLPVHSPRYSLNINESKSALSRGRPQSSRLGKPPSALSRAKVNSSVDSAQIDFGFAGGQPLQFSEVKMESSDFTLDQLKELPRYQEVRYLNGRIYMGQIANNLREGCGIMKYPSGR